MKKIASISLFCLALLFWSCEGDKAPGSAEDNEAKDIEPIELFLTSCETTDSSLCGRDACISSDCGIEDYYFTPKGNVLQRVSCVNEEDALWVIGKYRIGDSGIVCQMDRVYIVNLRNKAATGIDSVDYNHGQYTNLDNREPYMLLKSDCNGVFYTKRYTERIREMQREQKGSAAFGRVYFENKDWETRMLAEMRKVKAFNDL